MKMLSWKTEGVSYLQSQWFLSPSAKRRKHFHRRSVKPGDADTKKLR